MKRKKFYSSGRYKTFKEVKQLLTVYESKLVVMVDQEESYYLAYPDDPILGKRTGTLFAAVQIMEVTIDLFIGILMDSRESFEQELLNTIDGILDSKGVIHIFRLDNALKNALSQIINHCALSAI